MKQAVLIHSLDGVGNEGVLVAFAGQTKNMNLVQYVSFYFINI